MTQAAHTPGPWRIYDKSDDPEVEFPGIEADGFSVVVFGYEGEYSGLRGEIEALRYANAARIVACVNACEGISDPSVVGEAIEALRWSIDTLQEINPSNYDHDDVCALNAASVEVIFGLQAILAKLEGGEA